jgi:tetratricopeptide (TPR) repeat protein
MGVVYAAYDNDLDRKVAVKLMQARGPESSARLLGEAQAMARVSHPNVAQIYEVGTHQGQVYIAMEFVHGDTLRQWLRARARGWRAVLAVFVQAGRGLAAAHRAGVVHRDFKPDNVMIDAEGRAVVLDFGVAASRRGGASGASPGSDGELIGTPAYMAPEQWHGAAVDGRADQFAFCVALYEAVYGGRPFAAGTAAELAMQVAAGAVVEPPRGRGPAWLRRAVLRGLRPAASERYPAMTALVEVLGRDRSRRWRLLGLAALGLAVGAGVAVAAGVADRACSGVAGELAGVWDPPRRSGLRAALAASGSPLADATWPRLAAQLDGYAGAWLAAAREACEATTVRGEASAEVLDLRNQCLATRRRALAALVDTLVEGDARAVELALSAAERLPDVAMCSDAGYLRARVEPPGSPAQALAVAALRDELARARARADAGDLQGSAAQADAAAARAGAVEYPPVQAEALLWRGMMALRLADYPRAADDLQRAFHLGLRAGADEVAANAAARLAGAMSELSAPVTAAAWLDLADDLVARSGDERLAAGVISERGALACAHFVCDDATVELERRLAARERELGPTHPRVGGMLQQLGGLYLLAGVNDRAEAAYRRALAIDEATRGPDHPQLVPLLANLAQVLAGQERHDEAAALLRRALALARRSYGGDHLHVGRLHEMLANVELQRGDLGAAERHARAAFVCYEGFGGEGASRAVRALVVLAEVLRRRGAAAGAAATLEQALAREPVPPAIAGRLLAMLASVEAEIGRPAPALGHADRALGGPAGRQPEVRAEALAARAEALLELGDAAAATTAALAMPEDAPPGPRGRASFVRARAAADPATALALARTAEAALADAGPEVARHRGALARWLATHAG